MNTGLFTTPPTFITRVTVTPERVEGRGPQRVKAGLTQRRRPAVSVDAGTDHDVHGEGQLQAVGAGRVLHPGVVTDRPVVALLHSHGQGPGPGPWKIPLRLSIISIIIIRQVVLLDVLRCLLTY